MIYLNRRALLDGLSFNRLDMKVNGWVWILVIVIFFGAGVLILPRLARLRACREHSFTGASRGEACTYILGWPALLSKDGATAFALMRSLGLGISESDYNKLAAGNTALRASVKAGSCCAFKRAARRIFCAREPGYCHILGTAPPPIRSCANADWASPTPIWPGSPYPKTQLLRRPLQQFLQVVLTITILRLIEPVY